MKTSHYYTAKMFVFLMLILFSSTKVIKSQTSYLQVGTTFSPFINNNGNLLIGFGTFQLPTYAKLHVFSNSGFSPLPLLQTEVRNVTTGWVASIQQCINVGYQNYGIYQTSATSSGLKNYFQDPVIMGKVTIGNYGTNASKIYTGPYIDSLKFIMDPLNPTGDALFPLTIYPLKIRVRGNLVTDNFQLLTNPGTNYLLASDASGNGNWVNPSNFLDDYWQELNGNIYTNYPRVGIGTNKPSRSLEICHTDETGGIVLNQISAETNINTTEIRFERSGEEKFALGYYVSYDRPAFFIWNHIRQRTAIYIDGSNGMTGIDTEWPSAKLEVNGDFKATAIGIGINPPASSDSYKLFVEGGIAAREVKVTINTFPDYCFADNYQLMSISDLGKFISENKHLPGMPSAKEVAENKGFELGAMQSKLVEKVEQQTLYILDLQKQINDLKKQIEILIIK
jgi:hypothetical protein